METITITPTSKQIEAHKSLQKNTMVLFGGAIRGSKSYWGCLEIITFCFTYPKSRWLMCRESWGNIEGKLLVTFKENFLDKGFSQYVKEFNRNTYTLTWNNGSQIVFMAESYNSDKELNRFRGLEINGAFIDEVNEIQEITLNKIIERSGSWFHSPGCPIKILMSCNPTNGWVKERFYDKWKTNSLPKNIDYIPAKITDNPYIPFEYIESLKMLPRYEYEVFVEGNWDIQLKTGGEFFEEFELEKHVKYCTVDNDMIIHISVDSNVYPYIAVSCWQIDKSGNRTVIRQVNELPAKDPINTAKKAGENVVKWLKEIGYNQSVYLYGDPTTKQRNNIDENKKTFLDLFKEPFLNASYTIQEKFFFKAPPVAATGEYINYLLSGKDENISIEISDICKISINDYIETKKDNDGGVLKKREKDPKTGVSYEPNGHLTDCKRYFITKAFENEFNMFRKRFTNYSEINDNYSHDLSGGF